MSFLGVAKCDSPGRIIRKMIPPFIIHDLSWQPATDFWNTGLRYRFFVQMKTIRSWILADFPLSIRYSINTGRQISLPNMPSNRCSRRTHEVTIQACPRPDSVVASCGSCAITLVKVMRIPCLGRSITIGRASIVWPGVSSKSYLRSSSLTIMRICSMA